MPHRANKCERLLKEPRVQCLYCWGGCSWEWRVIRLESDISLKGLIKGEAGENAEGLVSCPWGRT